MAQKDSQKRLPQAQKISHLVVPPVQHKTARYVENSFLSNGIITKISSISIPNWSIPAITPLHHLFCSEFSEENQRRTWPFVSQGKLSVDSSC